MRFSVSMFPIGSGDHLSHSVAEVVDEFDRAGLSYQVSAMDPVLEGDWGEVMPVIHRAFQRLAEGHDRAYLTIAVDEHKGAKSRLKGAVEDIDRELGRTASD